jgi:hypothetical protein
MTCYNAGIDGNGIILNFGFLKMILQRYTPKLIIYDVTNFDMYQDENTKYLANLRAYYDKPGISKIFNDVDATERWKMLSKMYRYNSDFLGLLGDNLHPMQSFEKGYWPSNKVMDYVPSMPSENKTRLVDDLKISYLHLMIGLAKSEGVDLVFVASPTYFGKLLQQVNNPIREVCDEDDVPFIDYFYDDTLCSSKNYWADATHLNDEGAHFFSRKVINEIRNILNN